MEFDVKSIDEATIHTIASEVFRAVWRTTLDMPGFALLRFVHPFDSVAIRTAMVSILNSLSRTSGTTFLIERLGRFDQQVSTRFHRDGAPEQSLLLLGYEPTTVPSRFYVADACRSAQRNGLGIIEYLKTFNPILPRGEAELRPDVTELKWQNEHGAILIVNNSLVSDHFKHPAPLGLLHQGIIVEPDPNARRVINSLGAMIEGESSRSAVPKERLEWFLEGDTLD